MRTALSCWKRFSSRGSVVVLSVAKVESGTSLPSGAGDVDVLELVRRQALAALDLRDDLVAAPLDAEAVDVVAAEQRREVAARLAQVDALRAHLVAVEDDLGLRLVELQVGVGEHEEAARERLPTSWLANSASCCGLGGRGDDEVDREVAAARAAPAAISGITRTPGIFDELAGRLDLELLRWSSRARSTAW